MILAALGRGAAASLAAAIPADAAVSSASIDGTTATLNLDGADDNVTVSVSGGLLVHGQTAGGLNSGSDWDSATPGDQTVPADGTFTVVVNGGDGNDSLTVLAKNTEIAARDAQRRRRRRRADRRRHRTTRSSGGDGNDRLVGAKGADLMSGGAGNDTLVWNNGDGSDRHRTATPATTPPRSTARRRSATCSRSTPTPGGVKFQRTNLVPFTLDTATERFQVNGLGGNDSVAASDGVGALTLLSVDGGAGDGHGLRLRRART